MNVQALVSLLCVSSHDLPVPQEECRLISLKILKLPCITYVQSRINVVYNVQFVASQLGADRGGFQENPAKKTDKTGLLFSHRKSRKEESHCNPSKYHVFFLAMGKCVKLFLRVEITIHSR